MLIDIGEHGWPSGPPGDYISFSPDGRLLAVAYLLQGRFQAALDVSGLEGK